MPGSVPDRQTPGDVRVLVIDDHPALRDGLEGLLRQTEVFRPLGALPGDEGVDAALDQLQPDVVILDYALQRGDGLSICFRIKQRERPPGVVLYSAYVDDVFAVPATLAQADAIVSKTAPVADLLDAIHAAADGRRRMPALQPDAMTAASSRLAASELPIAGMLFSRTSVRDIAETLGVTRAEVRQRALAIIGRLRAGDRPQPAALPLG